MFGPLRGDARNISFKITNKNPFRQDLKLRAKQILTICPHFACLTTPIANLTAPIANLTTPDGIY
jgi:hypothetical protein